MFRNILVPLEGSENAYSTLEYAANGVKNIRGFVKMGTASKKIL